jgi:hypothetical protein
MLSAPMSGGRREPRCPLSSYVVVIRRRASLEMTALDNGDTELRHYTADHASHVLRGRGPKERLGLFDRGVAPQVASEEIVPGRYYDADVLCEFGRDPMPVGVCQHGDMAQRDWQ